jgi:hypothetical protein
MLRMMILVMNLALCELLWLPAADSFFIPLGRAGITKPTLFESLSPRHQRHFTLMSALPPGWQELKVPNSARKYYYNPTTGVTQWDFPGSSTASSTGDGAKQPQKIELMVPEEIRDRRAEKYEILMAKQRLNDAEKAKQGTLAIKSNQSALVLTFLFIGGPLLTLAILFLTGIVPNPFEVCIEGGTSC